MKKRSNLYIILTYLFFIYPPFIWGFVLIYNEGQKDNEHLISLLINVILISLIAGICAILIRQKKLHIPDNNEIKNLLFGLVGNIVVYFYTFQNIMNIDDYVTIYLILLLVLGVHYLLISRKFSAKELWILMPIFLLIDFIHLIVTGCGYTDGSSCYQETQGAPFLMVLYSIIVLASLGYYIYKVYVLKQNDIMKYANIALVTLFSIIIQDVDMVDEKVMLTIAILLPLFTIIDFVVNIVNKKYTHKILFFYIRMYTILMICSMLGAMDFFSGDVSYEILTIMVSVTYVSLFIIIFSSLLKVDETKESKISKDIIFELCNASHIENIKESFGEMKSNYVSLDEKAYSIVAIKGNDIVGFISSSIKPLSPPLDEVYEAYIDIIEVKEEFRRIGIATKLIERTEKHFKSKDFYQIRGWSNQDRIEAINLWHKLKFSLSPTLIHLLSNDSNINGYYFIKKF